MKKKKNSVVFDPEFIKKAARLLKGETLNEEDLNAYKLHKPARRKYRRLKINNVVEKNEQWSIDLADMKHLSRYNKNYRYLLVCVDVYSRYAFVKMLKNKTAVNTAKKIESIFLTQGEIPKKIQCDEGMEFQKIRTKLSCQYGFSVFSTLNREIKSAHAERFIRTLKEMIERTRTVLKTNNYASFLDAIVEKYNESPHKGLFNLTPREVYIEGKSLNKIRRLKRILNNSVPAKRLLKVGDRVRFSKLKKIFDKSSLSGWTDEIFTIDKIYLTDPVTYRATDLQKETIIGKFYREELQKIS